MNGPRADSAAPTGKPATPRGANQSDHPPKPRFTLAIGMVGHRLEHWDDAKKGTDGRPLRTEHLQKIAGDVHIALKAIRGAAIKAYHDHESLFDDTADAKQRAPELTLVSTLADGADTIVAKTALGLGYALDAPLPFAQAAYEKDFGSDIVDEHTPTPLQDFRALVGKARSILPLPGQRKTEADTREQGDLKENRAYETVGLTVLSQADILLAVWDGDRSRGRGGTAEMVAEAARQRIPIIHVDANGKAGPRILGGNGELYVAADAVEDLTPVELENGLAKLVEDLVRPPAAVPSKREQLGLIERYAPALASEADALMGFLGERFRRRNLRPEFPIMLAMSGVRGYRMTDYRPNAPAELANDFLALSPPASDSAPSTTKILAEAYGWADTISIRFAQVFRGAVIANFTLAACTIILAAFSLALPPEGKVFFVAAEFVLIGLILVNTMRGWRAGWHRRWFEAREVAERLRTALPLWALGIRPDTFFGQEPTWTGWYARAIVRSQGMRDARQNPNWLAEAHSTLQKVLDDQCTYHIKSAEQMGKLERRIELLGLFLFFATFLLALMFVLYLLYLLIYSPSHGIVIVSPPPRAVILDRAVILVTALSASLPALASAIYAIRVIGDFGGGARRSERTLAALEVLRKEVERDADDLRSLRVLARAAAEAMLGDVASWRLATESRALDIP
jgi:hypothetical protein